MSNRLKVSATIFEYDCNGFAGSDKELWSEICQKMSLKYPDHYQYSSGESPRLLVLSSEQVCPSDNSLVLYRYIRSAVIRHSQNRIMIALNVGNCFYKDGMFSSSEEVSSGNSTISAWGNRVSAISHKEHLLEVSRFVENAKMEGCRLSEIDLDVVIAQLPTLINGAGATNGQRTKPISLMRRPFRAGQGREIFLAGELGNKASSIAGDFENCYKRLCGVDKTFFIKQKSDLIKNDSILLVVIPESIDLAKDNKWRDHLSRLEDEGQLFCLAKRESLSNKFARDGIIFKLFMLDDGCPWIGQYSGLSNVWSVDAGHDESAKKSLWVSSSYDITSNRLELSYFDLAKLHEDIPNNVLTESLQSFSTHTQTFFRDGRFHKGEVDTIKKQGIHSENIFSIKKKPVAVLFRGSMKHPEEPGFGDCVRYPDGTALVQSIDPGTRKYQRPIALNAEGALSENTISDVLTLCKQPTLSTSWNVRLPAPIYWTDLASKRSVDKWAQAIGRGWRVPGIF